MYFDEEIDENNYKVRHYKNIIIPFYIPDYLELTKEWKKFPDFTSVSVSVIPFDMVINEVDNKIRKELTSDAMKILHKAYANTFFASVVFDEEYVAPTSKNINGFARGEVIAYHELIDKKTITHTRKVLFVGLQKKYYKAAWNKLKVNDCITINIFKNYDDSYEVSSFTLL